jgi:DNA-binding transcriptional regulator YdaS (Cro superfamily)
VTEQEKNLARRAFDRVIDIVGSQTELAKRLKVKQPSVNSWKMRCQIPADRVLEVEKIVGGEVTRYEMRPDVFGKGNGVY